MADTVMKNRIARAIAAITVAAAFAVSFTVPAWDLTYAADGYDQVAGSSEMAEMKDVGKYGMVPIYGKSIKNGEYEAEMESSSSFFSIYSCDLTVKGNHMNAVMTINSTSYKCVYMGKAADAAKAEESEYIFAD